MGIVRLVKPVKANMPQKMEEENLIQVSLIMKSRQATLRELCVLCASRYL